jgi:hypothetical protein
MPRDPDAEGVKFNSPGQRPRRDPMSIRSWCRGAAREGSQTRSVWIRRNQAFRVEDAGEFLAHLSMRTF